jgi:hypothetical protein
MLPGYIHGPVPCRLCFGDSQEHTLGDWRLLNNPGYFGSKDPEILVLGFSKGANQNKIRAEISFDKIAFAGARGRLKAVLESLKIMPSDRGIDALMTKGEQIFGFTSFVRCSLCKMQDGVCKTSGDVIPNAFANVATMIVIRRCVKTFLSTLPERVRLVVLLGTSDNYIAKTRSLLREIHADYSAINEVAFRTGNKLWIYAAHPSPANGHFKAWISGNVDDPSGKKRILAIKAVELYCRDIRT